MTSNAFFADISFPLKKTLRLNGAAYLQLKMNTFVKVANQTATTAKDVLETIVTLERMASKNA